jgi:Mrp family chromosome partitioning ATPase
MNTEVQLLRAHLETATSGPSIVMVTSAEAGDGKSLLAHALAHSLAKVGRRCALFDATLHAKADLSRLALPEAGARPNLPVVMPLPLDDPSLAPSREVLAQFMDTVRASYDYAIVDTPPFLSSDLAMALAEAADGILVSVRVGRAPSERDLATIRVIEASKGNVIGVVAATPEAIKDFKKMQSAAYKAVPVEQRKAQRKTDEERSAPVEKPALLQLLGRRAVAALIALGIASASLFAFLEYSHSGRALAHKVAASKVPTTAIMTMMAVLGRSEPHQSTVPGATPTGPRP